MQPFCTLFEDLILTIGLITAAFAIILDSSPAFAQSWETTSIPQTSRFNDVFFATPDSGWAVSGSARIYRTTDGGTRWSEQFFQPESHLRSVGFLDGERGFAGNVGFGEFGTTDRTPLYETSDGGDTWSPVGTFHGQRPTGLCGMHVVNDSTVVAVGRVRGPAFFVRTTDYGTTWQSKNMGEYASGLIDVYFPHPDTGFAVGLISEAEEPVNAVSRGIVLATVDGGETWEERIVTSRLGEWAWKMSWPTRETGYVSLQRDYEGPVYFLKTTDAGLTWEEKHFASFHYYVQGIGFVDENTGWIGGNSSYPPYVTTDGGETWTPTDIGIRLNRFRFLSDTLGYAAGATIHRYVAPSGTAVQHPTPSQHAIGSVFPNPFSHEASLFYTLDSPSVVAVSVHDLLGRTVRTITADLQPAGRHNVRWDGRNQNGATVAGGTYFIVVRINDSIRTLPVLFFR